MTSAPRPWLPDSAIAAATDRALATAARDWSARWLARSELRSLGGRSIGTATEAPSWHRHGPDLAIGIAATASASLARRMLDLTDDATITDADRAIIDPLGVEALDDLRATLAKAFDQTERSTPIAAGPAATSATRHRALGLSDGATLIQLAIGDGAAIAAARARLSSADRTPPLAPLTVAIAPQPVTLAARVGGSRMTLADLTGLEAGDVVLLDRALGDDADLTVDHRSRPLARCAVEAGEDTLSLTLLEPINR